MVSDWIKRGTSARHRPLSASTIRKCMVTLSADLNKAVELDLLKKNPAKSVSLPRVTRKEKNVLEPRDAMRLLWEIKDRNSYIPTLIFVATGMRCGEILALR